MRERYHPAVRLGDELSLHVVELRKADRAIRGVGDDGDSADDGAVGDGDGDGGVGVGVGVGVAVRAWAQSRALALA